MEPGTGVTSECEELASEDRLSFPPALPGACSDMLCRGYGQLQQHQHSTSFSSCTSPGLF